MDTIVLKALSERKVFERLREHVPASMLAPDTTNMLAWYKIYFDAFPDHEAVGSEELASLIQLRANADADTVQSMRILQHQVNQVPPESAHGILNQLNELAFSGKMAALIAKYEAGDEVDLFTEVKMLERRFAENKKVNDDLLKWEDRSVDEILAANEEGCGLKLRTFPQLEGNIRALRGGDTVAVAAPVDAGKTSLLAAIASDFAQQVKDAPDRYGDRPAVLWLVNESVAARTVPRIYSAAIAKTGGEIRKLHQAGKFIPLYTKTVGRMDAIRVKDAHSITMPQVFDLLEQMKPVVLIIDMVANIRGGCAESEHQNLEAKWQDLRIAACEHDCIVVGTMQMSAEGYDTLYPPLTALKQSKVGVQGALDLAIFMGRMNADTEGMRGISTPKNKLPAEGRGSLNQFMVQFHPQTCGFDSGVSGYGVSPDAAAVAENVSSGKHPRNGGAPAGGSPEGSGGDAAGAEEPKRKPVGPTAPVKPAAPTQE